MFSRQSAYRDAPYSDLIDITLRQFKRPLEAFGVELSPPFVKAVAQALAARAVPDDALLNLRAGLARVVEESEAVLAAWGWGFADSLNAEMSAVPGWESTADFLEVANIKSNAELRIAAGSALVAALGDGRFAEHLFYLLAHPQLDEPGAILAERVLSHISGIPVTGDMSRWIQDIRHWLKANPQT